MVIVAAMLVILCKRLYFQETPDQVYKIMLRENAPLMIYPVLFHIVKLLGLAHRLYQITTTIHNNTILWIIHAAIAPLNSLSCAIVYSLFVIIEHLYKEPQPDEAVSKSQQLDNVKENRIDHQWSIFSQHDFVDLVWCLLEVQPLA